MLDVYVSINLYILAQTLAVALHLSKIKARIAITQPKHSLSAPVRAFLSSSNHFFLFNT